jgi:hypothetical protein
VRARLARRGYGGRPSASMTVSSWRCGPTHHRPEPCCTAW